MWLTSRRLALLATIGALTAGCAGKDVYLGKTFAPPRRVALLPMANETTDLDGPPFVRQLLFNHLANRGYDLIPLAEVDSKLLAQGFTDGGQLNAATPEKLGEWIGADTLFYSNLEYFDYISIGFYSQRRVKLSGKMVDAKTGERIWEAERDGTTRVVVGSKKAAEQQFAAQLAVKAVERATHSPLQPESRLAVKRLIDTIPR